jgi:hypothetical protein
MSWLCFLTGVAAGIVAMWLYYQRQPGAARPGA